MFDRTVDQILKPSITSRKMGIPLISSNVDWLLLTTPHIKRFCDPKGGYETRFYTRHDALRAFRPEPCILQQRTVERSQTMVAVLNGNELTSQVFMNSLGDVIPAHEKDVSGHPQEFGAFGIISLCRGDRFASRWCLTMSEFEGAPGTRSKNFGSTAVPTASQCKSLAQAARTRFRNKALHAIARKSFITCFIISILHCRGRSKVAS